MILNALDPSGNPWNEAALHALGADTISYPPGSGPVVSPDIDLAGYAASVVKAEADYAQREPIEPPLTNAEIAGLRKLLKS